MSSFRKLFTRANLPWLVFLIFVSLAVGIIIASGFDLSSRTQAGLKSELKTSNQPLGHSPFVAVAAKVKDAVVNISAEKALSRGSLGEEFFFWHPRTRGKYLSLGSGFIFDKRGYVLTNNHVITGADDIRVKLSDDTEYKAKLVGTDKATDIAILKINAGQVLAVATLGDSDSIQVGDWAIAIGNPFPQQGLDRTVTVGVISAKGRRNLTFNENQPVDYQDYIQTDAAINRGNSGGPLVNVNGEVIGINSAIASSEPSGGNIGIGFAIPINLAKMVIPELIKEGRVARGWLGVRPKDLSPDLVEALDLSFRQGVLVEEVLPNTPAARGGLAAGDVIVKFDGKKVVDAQQFMFLVAQTQPNSKVLLELYRKGQPRSISLVLGTRPEELARRLETPEKKSDEESGEARTVRWLGMVTRTATEELCAEYEVPYRPGVIVTEVEPSSPADEKGISEGDILVEVQGEKIRDVNDLSATVAKLGKRTKPVSLIVRDRRGFAHYLALRPAD